MNVCGGDLAVINMDLYKSREDFWRKIFEARKSYLHQARLIGFDILILLLLRRFNFQRYCRESYQSVGYCRKGIDLPLPGNCYGY